MAENVRSAVADVTGIVTNFNAIHNVFSSAWLVCMVINELQVLVPFLGVPNPKKLGGGGGCAPLSAPPPLPPLPAPMQPTLVLRLWDWGVPINIQRGIGGISFASLLVSKLQLAAVCII